MIVCKFGGSSCANAEQIRKVAAIVLDDPARRVVVVSAPGKRSREDMKVTDLLIALANARVSGYDGAGEFRAVLARFEGIVQDLELDETVMNEITSNINGLMQAATEGRRKQYIDALKAAGEDNCARILVAYLNKIGHRAFYVSPREAGLILRDTNGNIDVLPESYINLRKLFKFPGIVVFPGFFGIDEQGETITFSRGGSDITGSILATALSADVYENWTDVDHVYSVNPELIPNPQPIREISYQEMRELAYIGFTVIHPEAMIPVFRKEIPIHIRNTNNPESEGTFVVSQRTNLSGVVTGIAGSKNFCSLNVRQYLLNREIGVAARVLNILAEEGIPIDHMPTGIDSLSVVMREDVFSRDKEKRVIDRLMKELEMSQITVARGLAIVMLVGEAMLDTVGVTARATTALSRAGVSLEMIVQDYNEISIMFIVDQKYCNYAVEELYREFFINT